MPFNLHGWLTEEIEWRDALGNTIRGPRHLRLCWLTFANGGPQIRGWGVISSFPNGHQQGLDQNDALELMQLYAFVNGLAAAGVDTRVIDEFFIPYADQQKA